MSLALLAFALALPFLERRLGPRVRDYLVDPGRVRVVTSPAALEPGVVEQIASSLERLPAASLRDERSVTALTDALPRVNPWIREVVAAYKRYPNELEVHVDVRQPVAMVAGAASPWLVDAEKVIAPAQEAMGIVRRDRLPLVALEDADRGPQLTAGLGIPETLVKGVQVAVELRPHLEELAERGIEIALIQVHSPAQEASLSEVDLYTPQGLRVEWGRPRSGPLQSLEPSPGTKVQNLLRAAAQYPGFVGVRVVRVQFDTVKEASVLFDPSRPSGWAMDRSDAFNMP